MQERRRGDRLTAVGVLGLVLLGYPLLAVADRPAFVAGIPVLYLYLFGAWGLVIALLGLFGRRRS